MNAPPVHPCVSHPNNAACIGSWDLPVDLCISCHSEPSCGLPCKHSSGLNGCLLKNQLPGVVLGRDEIAHATLIPVDGVDDGIDHVGNVLLWTLCARRTFRVGAPYRSWIWDPTTDDVYEGPLFEGLNDDAYGDEDPFCGGHTWMLDAAENPKFLVAGGANPPAGKVCSNENFPASIRTAWFDPLADFTNWLDGPPELTQALWYPSVSTFHDEGNARFLPVVVGGTECFNGGAIYPDVWSWTPGAAGWTEHSIGTYPWRSYPRLLLLSSGDFVSVGHQTELESAAVDYAWPMDSDSWGGNPVQGIDVSQAAHFEGPDPNFVPGTQIGQYEVGGLNYGNAVLLHTLKGTWVWDEAAWELDIDVAVAQYDLDRVILTGGSVDRSRPESDDKSPAQAYTLELEDAPDGPWRVKAPAMPGRVFGNFVLLPDGTILLAGGQDSAPAQRTGETNPDPIYYSKPQIFDPEGPSDVGTWKSGAPRRPWPDELLDEPVSRGYHSVAILLQDGVVALMGGKKDERGEYSDNEPNDTVEVYKPPYCFGVPRPRILAAPDTIHYGEAFCVSVPNAARIVRASLVGVGSATHHFDYGQRYLELMVNDEACEGGNLDVLAPPRAAMAPAGYYLLFVVVRDGGGRLIPSRGEFVKVTF